MRLDIFLPVLRRPKCGDSPRPERWLGRLARRLAPVSWLADRSTGRPGRIRRGLTRLGPTWRSSPVRRGIQTACFALFVGLFFVVCWPYTARPSRVWAGWSTKQADETGQIVLTAAGATAESPAETPAPGSSVFLAETGAAVDPPSSLGRFTVATAAAGEIALTSETPLTPDQLAQLSFGGPWALSETPPGQWPAHYADDLAAKELVPAEVFLALDPLVSISTALAAKTWVWSLSLAAVMLGIGVLIPRGFCGYLCPLGTLIDLFDWAVGGRVQCFRAPDNGWWVHIKYYLLAGSLVAALCGVLLTGYVAAIPVITRGLMFVLAPLQVGVLRGPHQIPPLNAGHYLSIGLFLLVLGLGLLKPRFWCKYVCPSGAVFSVGNLLRLSERKVEASCIHCNRCVEICPFDAIKADFTTRTSDCTLCQTCGGVCPTQAIKFVERWNRTDLKLAGDPPTGETRLGRRGFLSLTAGATAAATGGVAATMITRAFGANLDTPDVELPVRPPGSVPEREFLQLCIRCGECFKVCPNHVLQPLGFQQGLEGLWTPQMVADWAGCESSCNACGQVCPTGAIRALPIEEKKAARMGLAVVNQQTCLPYAAREACQLCVDECVAAGYHAIEFTRVHSELDDQGLPVEDSGFLAPVVLADKCVGCGLCQTRCYRINVKLQGLLAQSAIIVAAGRGKEDRLHHGSYVQLREQERRVRQAPAPASGAGAESYLPDFLR
jgi:ferredoxin